MTSRTGRLWVPALVTLTLAIGALRAQMLLGIEPVTLFSGWGPSWGFYVPWLAVLPFIAAVGSRLSLAAGGEERDRLLAGLAPTLALSALMIVMLIPETLFDTPRHGLLATIKGVVWYLVCWIGVPGSMLLLGSAVAGKFWTTDSARRIASREA